MLLLTATMLVSLGSFLTVHPAGGWHGAALAVVWGVFDSAFLACFRTSDHHSCSALAR
jgi:hypothetical protein